MRTVYVHVGDTERLFALIKEAISGSQSASTFPHLIQTVSEARVLRSDVLLK